VQRRGVRDGDHAAQRAAVSGHSRAASGCSSARSSTE
jgi:hypothetical protein